MGTMGAPQFGQARRGPIQFRMAMGAEEVDHRIVWDFIFLIHRETAVKTRQTEPSVFDIERDGHPNRWIAIDIVALIHQAMIATRATDLHRKDPFVGLNIHPIESDRPYG